MSEVEYSVVDLGAVTAYAQAVENGYEGTLEQWVQLQINSASNYEELFNEIYNKNSSAALWEQGGLNMATGNTASSTSRIRTTDFLPESVDKIVMNTGYYVLIYAYGEDGTFGGVLQNNYSLDGQNIVINFITNGSYVSSCLSGTVDLRKIRNTWVEMLRNDPNADINMIKLKFKVAAAFGDQGTTAIAPAAASNIVFYQNAVGYAVDNDLIGIGENEPTSDRAVLWIDGENATAVQIPQIDDAHVSDVDTWSSEKIDNKLSQLSEEIADTDKVVEKLSFDNVMNTTRDVMPNQFVPYSYPAAFTGTYKPVGIFTDGTNYVTDFDPERFKNTGSSVMYCAPISTGAASSKAGTFEDPKNLFGAIRDVADGGTIFVKEGNYGATDLGNVLNGSSAGNLLKNFNLIGLGKAVFAFGSVYYPDSANKSYDSINNLYTITRAGTIMVVGSNFQKWEKVDTLDKCKAAVGTWYINGSTVYLNANEEPTVYVCQAADGMSINPTSGLKQYFENITFVGGKYSVYVTAPSSGEIETVWYKCNFLDGATNSSDNVFNAFRFCGNKCLCVDCVAAFGVADGFGYNEKSGIQFVEIGCIGANNGDPVYMSNAVANGSTCHQAAKGIRVNGVYYSNYGANVADVHTNTQTINLGCAAKNSKGVSPYNQGFAAQQSGAEMWLENCKAFGNTEDVYNISGSTMHLNKVEYATRGANGTFDETDSGFFIATGDDLNDYTTPGDYSCLSETVAQSLSNCPTANRFTLEVKSLNTYCMQIIYTENKIYTRRSGYSNGYAWRSWYEYSGTAVN